MRLDNSRARLWHKCPAAYQERYIWKIQKDYAIGKAPATTFGKRQHELLEEYSLGRAGGSIYEPSADPGVEDEAQVMFEAYKAFYPQEPWEVVDVEKLFEVPLPDSEHTYTGKVDLIVRDKKTATLQIVDHKTEKRGGKSNLPGVWAAKAQVSLYLWAAQQIYNEPFGSIVLNVLTRQSPKGQKPPEFRRDNLQRTPAQQEEAVRNIVWVADQIEQMEREFGREDMWAQDRDNCQVGNSACEYRDLHLYGRDERLIQIAYRPAEEYLNL